uniref:Uncharacterized protein n=1 Tax=Avena sativa TaxID=4498 RepID=A0ACD5U082_AVESA
MDRKKRFTTERLTDDLVVKILSQVPFKSFCRFKCVCKAWLGFSSDQHYLQMLPKIPTGLLLGRGSSVQLVRFSPNDEQIDGILTFLPHYEHLEFVDYCNGFVLCKYKASSTTSSAICRFIVCNPATREWRMLPDTHGSRCETILAFDPSWSTQFYVFNLHKKARDSWQPNICKLEVFSSDLSTWLVDDEWCHPIGVDKPHIFIGGVLYVQKSGNEILVLEGWDAMRERIQPVDFTIKLLADSYSLMDGCFGQSSGLLQCAFLEEGGRRVAIWSFNAYLPCKWSLKHRINMQDAFGRDYFDRISDPRMFSFGRIYFDRTGDGDMFSWLRGYRILALDLERDVLLLIDREAKNILSYNISNGKLSEIQYAPPLWKYYYYVACHSKLPG